MEAIHKGTPSYATNEKRKRPRSRSEWEVLRKWEIERGYPLGSIGNRVWVDEEDPEKGFYELDAAGEITGRYESHREVN